MSASDLVRRWKEKAAQKAAERAALVQSVPITFDGFTGKAHRLFLLDWARAGRCPQFLTAAMLAAVKGKSVEARKDDLSPEEMAEYLRFQCVAFCSMMDEPRFSTDEDRKGRELAEDEMDYADFVTMCPEVVRAAVEWQLNGCPDIPVLLEGGETMTLDELESFRDGGEWLASPERFYDGQGVYWVTQPSARVM